MINAITGDIVIVKDQEVVLRAGSVEFSLIVSGQTASKMAAFTGERRENVRLLAVLSHHEDSMLLYGFYDEWEREAFTQLQSVGGIGPKQALKILSGISVENLAKALDQSDVKFLSNVPGVGPKTAQKMILQLRNKLVIDEETEKQTRDGNATPFSEVVAGLTEMGYERRKAEDAISRIVEQYKEKLENLSQADQETFVFQHAIRYLG
ncbi:MAG: Holliday junction branch migration protein RuvA [Sphaerochaetaceae bacterium]|jgi:Holliday junction DNA helicase RuvA